jgi:5'-nucleotidase
LFVSSPFSQTVDEHQNHDLDFGVKQYRYLTEQCKFPWLLANVLDPELGEDEPIGNSKKTFMFTTSNGLKIGFIGLAEREWLVTVNVLPPNLIYKSASATAKRLVPQLREAGADLVIAITHQREPNDNKLAANVPTGLIDIILGGHDHFYEHNLINDTHVLRSGSDFKQLSYIEAWRSSQEGRKWNFKIVRRHIVSSIPEDQSTLELMEKLTHTLKAQLEKPIGYTAAPLDARFTTVRLKESNIGNFVCDLMRHHYGADCAIMAAGTIRGDQIYPPGLLRLKDIMNCFPFEDPVVVIQVSGKAILEALENSVSLYPALEGRFPQVSNIILTFDPLSPPGSRVKTVKVGGQPLDLDRIYTLATRGYMARGKDGYDSLLTKSGGGTADEVISEENGMLISTIIRQYFLSLKVLRKWKQFGPSLGRHWEGIHDELHRSHPVIDPQPPQDKVVEAFQRAANKDNKYSRPNSPHHSGLDTPLDESEDEQAHIKPVPTHVTDRERELVIMRKVMSKWWRIAGLPGHPQLCDELGDGEFAVNWTKVSFQALLYSCKIDEMPNSTLQAISPRIEGRIRVVSNN